MPKRSSRHTNVWLGNDAPETEFLRALAEQSGRSHAAIVRDALSLYEFAYQAVQAGGEVKLGDQRVLLPSLERAARKAKP